MSKKETTYEVMLRNSNGEYEFEGVFTSLSEIADYLEMPKTTITAIFNHEHPSADIVIDRVYGAREFTDDLSKETDLTQN